ncbi:hypothetical protein B296_00057117 [Ensete ventricosum]|uniref:Uncharacterized protein n=1 Tax=Ensete ventricosum TaxID=4639 RepID=A0A426X6F4_ENSVE|nr:hypothetical protein B296_00057117 [Ensete ventricosum]
MSDRGCCFNSCDCWLVEAGIGRQLAGCVDGGRLGQGVGPGILEVQDLEDFEVLDHTYQLTGLNEIAGHREGGE